MMCKLIEIEEKEKRNESCAHFKSVTFVQTVYFINFKTKPKKKKRMRSCLNILFFRKKTGEQKRK